MSIEDPEPGEEFQDTRYGKVRYIGQASNGQMVVEDRNGVLRGTSSDHLMREFKVGQVWEYGIAEVVPVTIIAITRENTNRWVVMQVSGGEKPKVVSEETFNTFARTCVVRS